MCIILLCYQIVDVEPYSLVAQHGLPAKAPSVDGTNLCNWWITEVNHRPVNLFYKGEEVRIGGETGNTMTKGKLLVQLFSNAHL